MLKSMTGYGNRSENGYEIEIKSVNHRYLDCSIHTPRAFTFLEDTIKNCICNRLTRGKIDAYLTVDPKVCGVYEIGLNRQSIHSYLSAIGEMKEEFGLGGDPDIALLCKLPEVFTSVRTQPDSVQVTQTVVELTTSALDQLVSARECEGKMLCDSILSGITEILRIVEQIECRTPIVGQQYQARLTARIREMLKCPTLDESRIIMEAAIFADKVANNEETVRIRSHLVQLESYLNENDSQGRRIDFLLQELNRESNTIGSKGNDAVLAGLVVSLKAEIEKIREQAQNLE